MKNILYLFILLSLTNTLLSQSLSTDSFCLANKYAFGDSARYTRPILADMNQDGKMDLVLYDFDQKKIKYHKGNNSSFDAVPYVTSFTLNAISIDVGDMNGDYTQDIAVLNNTNGNITIVTNNSGILTTYTTIPPPTTFTTGSQTATHIFVKDFGYNILYQDIIVTANNGTNSGYYMLDNQSGISFVPTLTSTNYLTNLSSSFQPVINFADYNQDGLMDMAYTTPNSNGSISLILSYTSMPIYSP